MVVLTTLWDKYFTPEATLASYGCALSLRFSIHHATKLDHFLQQPPASWKDPESCQRISLSIVDAIRGGIQRWCAVAKQLVQRPIIDKLSVVALEILMLANSFFSQLVTEMATYERIVLECFQHIFCHAYPDHSISKPPKGRDNLRAFQTPTNGCLNCCLKPASVNPYPQQVEKKLLTEIHSLIPVFIKSCQVDSAAALLPILVHHVKEYSTDEAIVRSMLDGVASIVQSLIEDSMCRPASVKCASSIVDNIQLTFQEITLVLQDKTLEVSTIRQVLDMFLTLSHLTEGTEHLQLVFCAVSHRLELNGSTSSHFINMKKGSGEEEDSAFGSSHLAFRSNDIPASPVDDLRISDEDEDDREPPAHSQMLSESVALNASSGSSNTPRLSVSGGEREIRALTPTAAADEDDSGSDWDSWDEDEEDQTMTCSMFAEFMKKLKAQYSQVEHPGGPSPFQVELSNSRDRDRKLITSLLN
ncbi:uncharacterized protein [Amphiura filiformis]|uniref:uncharacterized protein n=1 Tax=Amphiura filiformis TaxID=82378 RepID=UPI003B219EB2